jgi:hypothetical protein
MYSMGVTGPALTAHSMTCAIMKVIDAADAKMIDCFACRRRSVVYLFDPKWMAINARINGRI